MRDPIEHYRYPEEWIRREIEKLGSKEVKKRIESGLYILTHSRWLKRGITTGTTASASAVGAITSLFEETDGVKVWTPSDIEVEVKVIAKNGVAVAKKFSGDHSFDVTNGVEIRAEISKNLDFGEGIGRLNGKPSISNSAMRQILVNIKKAAEEYRYDGSAMLSVPDGERIWEKTGNRRFGIYRGISILGTTGFVEPWCDELVEAKIRIASLLDKVTLTTGRKGWKWAKENLPDFEPIVMGVHFDKAIERIEGEIIIAGLPSLLIKWAFPELRGKILKGVDPVKFRNRILKKAKEINPNVVDVILLRDEDAM